MYYTDEFLKKKKPETFMDYNPGEIPKKPTKAQEPLTLGEVAPKTTERVAPRVTTKEESTYTTSNKDLQNIHRNRTNGERHTGRSLRDESNRRTTYVGVGVPDDPHSRENGSANPYGSPVKIVGDNVTKKDYDDFWNAFRNEGTGNKLYWSASQMKPQTQPQNAQQNTRSRDMMHWAMNSSKNLVTPQNPVLTSELRDIEAAEKGDKNSEWYKRLEEAWNSNNLEEYEKIEQEMKSRKDSIKNVLSVAGRINDDDGLGQLVANYQAGSLELEAKRAQDEYNKNPTLENKELAEGISSAADSFNRTNAETLENDITPAWILREVANNLPEIIDRAGTGIKRLDASAVRDAIAESDKEIKDKAMDIHYSRNQHNVDLPQNIKELPKGWRKEKAYCHQFTAPDGTPYIKFVSPDGKREVIFNSTGEYVITADEDMGTYNYADPDSWIAHGIVDILPWILYGNTPNDSTTMSERVKTLDVLKILLDGIAGSDNPV